MQDNEIRHETSVGELRKNREMMADGRRYIIYYTFTKNDKLGMMNDELNREKGNSSVDISDSLFQKDV